MSYKMKSTATAYLFTFFLLFGSVFGTGAQDKSAAGNEGQSIREKLSGYFSPPEEYRDNYGNYRSPLEFYDGRRVNSPKEWKKRRKEILEQWNGMMGKWPPLIRKQKME
ncbi:MAG TPA: hypothetical protein PLO24_12275, partial [Bacteroidales bacterium]|nr:hypothetical protein [Bacteroidales bacterium]